MRFLCDEMLRGVGRWLRAAGYDTVIAECGMADEALMAMAEREARVLLTCDRSLAARAAGVCDVVLLAGEAPEEAAKALRARLGVDWLFAPFSRCLRDNTRLRPATENERRQAPASARDGPGPIMACPACARVYWPGSHARRMRARLERWAG